LLVGGGILTLRPSPFAAATKGSLHSSGQVLSAALAAGGRGAVLEVKASSAAVGLPAGSSGRFLATGKAAR